MHPRRQLIYYVIAPYGGDRLGRQLGQSLRSLRRYDRDCPVHLLHCGSPSSQIVTEAAHNDAVVHELPEYCDLLAEHTSHWPAFAAYPTLHKILGLDRLPLDSVSQLLYLDCDTYWFADPRHLFRRYRTCDFYACAEVGSRGYQNWYDPSYLDEDKLAAICSAEGLTIVPPFNTGVMLMQTGLCERLLSLRSRFLETAARLLAGYQLEPGLSSVSPLLYPSSNEWLLDEIALWLTLGAIPELKLGWFDQSEVAISNLHIAAPPPQCVLAHYFSSQEEDFFDHHPRL
jgi:hypothetical protein